MTSKPINIVFWNANGIRRATTEIQLLAESCKADAILVCETRLSKNQNFGLPNYITYRNDRVGQAGGGTAVLLRKNLRHYPIDLPILRTVEATAVVVSIGGREVVLSSVYNRPAMPLSTEDLDVLLSIKPMAILAGDLNAKHTDWNSTTTNTRGTTLRTYADSVGVIVAGPEEPTHYHSPTGSSDVLDVAILSGVTSFYEMKVLAELDSDHYPVLLRLTEAECDANAPSARDHIVTNWTQYVAKMEETCAEVPLELSTPGEIDLAVEKFTKSIQNALAVCSTTARKKPFALRKLPEELCQLIKRKNRVRKIWQRYQNPPDKVRLNELRREIKEAVQKHRDERWAEEVASLSMSDKHIWQTTRRLIRTRPLIPALVRDDGTTAFEPQDKAELFADSLEGQFTPNPSTMIPENEHVDACVRQFLERPASYEASPVSLQELRGILRWLNKRKAPGHDGIGNLALVRLPDRAVEVFVSILNSIYKHGHFPASWKLAKVIVIPKPKKQHRYAVNHRPISLLSGLSKLFERTLLSRLLKHISSRDMLQEEQFGFRPGLSTTLQLLRLTEFITRGFNEKRHSAAVFLDIEKAFDKVWHQGLLYKLIYAGLPDTYVHLISSYLSERRYYVSSEGAGSTVRAIRAGVPQGSVIGPVLFNLYVSDIPRENNIAMYADDTALYSQSWCQMTLANRLQRQLLELEMYYSLWRIKVNAAKSVACFFTRRQVYYVPSLKLYEADIEWKPHVKYLGVTLDTRLNFRKHTDTVLGKAHGQFSRLYPLLNYRSALSLSVKRMIYQSFIRPICTYGAAAFMYEPSCRKRVQVFQNKKLRAMTGAHYFVRNRTLHQDLRIDTVDEFVLRQTRKLYDAVASHENSLVRELGQYEAHNPYYKHRRPKLLLEA